MMKVPSVSFQVILPDLLCDTYVNFILFYCVTGISIPDSAFAIIKCVLDVLPSWIYHLLQDLGTCKSVYPVMHCTCLSAWCWCSFLTSHGCFFGECRSGNYVYFLLEALDLVQQYISTVVLLSCSSTCDPLPVKFLWYIEADLILSFSECITSE